MAGLNMDLALGHRWTRANTNMFCQKLTVSRKDLILWQLLCFLLVMFICSNEVSSMGGFRDSFREAEEKFSQDSGFFWDFLDLLTSY